MKLTINTTIQMLVFEERESNLGHIGGRRVVSPLRHPCTVSSSSVIDYFIILDNPAGLKDNTAMEDAGFPGMPISRWRPGPGCSKAD